MGKLILVRHGESTGNRERIFATKPHELELTELGERQAREAGRAIAAQFNAEIVVASPYIRARETARIIAEVLTLSVHVEPHLHERDVGLFRGQPYESVLAAPDFDPKRPWLWKPPQGESFEDVKARVAPVADRLATTHRERDVVVVSHGGVMMALWAHFTGEWENAPIPANCGIVVVEHEAGSYRRPVVVNVAGDRTGADSSGG